jgi:hypothetical protein
MPTLMPDEAKPLGDRWECRFIAACPSPDHAVIARELICEHPLRPAKFRDRTLPAISFYKPIGADDEHPGYASLARGDYHAAAIRGRRSSDAYYAGTEGSGAADH